jgi:hypothetical protein
MLDMFQHAWQLALVHIDDQGLTNALLAEAVPYLRMRGRIGEQSWPPPHTPTKEALVPEERNHETQGFSQHRVNSTPV